MSGSLYERLFIIASVLLVAMAVFIAVRTITIHEASAKFDRAVDNVTSTPPDPVSMPILLANMNEASSELTRLRNQRDYASYATAVLALVTFVLFLFTRKEARDKKLFEDRGV